MRGDLKMPREQLIQDAVKAGQAAKHNLAWMDKHPERFDGSKKEGMQSYLHMLINFSKNEQKNTRSAKRASVATRFKDLFVSIIPQLARKVVMK
ncbi:MAG TPA: hypothetical protein IAA29_07805 [Candidatus Paenibacillus intestinavium]|nr:hypothetical protein [Candidatus Paenibacillus intestinavium]